MTDTPGAQPARTFALLVGVEDYVAEDIPELDGPAIDALRFARLLRALDVPASNILLCVSPLKQNRERLEEWTESEVYTTTRTDITSAISDRLQRATGDLLYVLWGGHGILTMDGRQRLFYSDARRGNLLNTDLNALLGFLRSDQFGRFPIQVVFVDACAHYLTDPWQYFELPSEQYPSSAAAPDCNQSVFLAASAGQFAENVSREKTGLFSKVLLEELESRAAGLLPDLDGLAERLRVRFSALRSSSRQLNQTPYYVAYRPWRGAGFEIGQPGGSSSGRFHVPTDLTSFIGRGDEIETVCNRFRSNGERLVSIVGAPGVGKTRLATESARLVGPVFRNGVIFVPLSSVADDSFVATELARVLGVYVSGEGVEQALIRRLQDLSVLLVLDTFEHVLPATALVAELLRYCPDLAVLVTSRTEPRIYGEVLIEMRSLTVPPRDGAHSAESVSKYEAVQLFDARAKLKNPKFAIDDGSAATIAELCGRVGGLPLAVELAAARTKYFSPAQMVAMMVEGQILPLLSEGPRDRPAKERTMHDAIEWSHRLLSEPQRIVFSQVAVFSGGFSPEAAETICSVPDGSGTTVVDVLVDLEQHSLLSRAVRGEHVRYETLDPIREYAAIQLESNGTKDFVEERHASYYLQLAENARSDLQGVKQAETLARLQEEYGNLRAALRTSLRAGRREVAVRLAHALWRFWKMRGLYAEGRTWLTAALTDASGLDARLRASATDAAGELALEQADYTAAEAYFRSALDLRRAERDENGIAWSLHHVGKVANARGDYSDARQWHEKALGQFRRLSDRFGVAWSLQLLADLSRSAGDHQQAAEGYRQSGALFEELEDKHGLAWSMHNRGRIAHDERHLEEAAAYYRDSAALFTSLGDQQGLAESACYVGLLERDQGRLAQAEQSLARSKAHYKRLGNPWGVALTLHGLGLVLKDRRSYEAAAKAFEETLSIRRDLDDRHGIAWSLYELADVADAQEDSLKACNAYAESARRFRSLDDERALSATFDQLAILKQRAGEAAPAVQLFAAAEHVRQQHNAPHFAPDRARQEEALSALRRVLGTDFPRLWELGPSLPLDEAVRLCGQ